TGLSDHNPNYPAPGLDTGIVGAVMSNDVANSSDTSGGGMTSAITDWTRFDNPYRFWASPSWPPSPCALGTNCRIWDIRLLANDPAAIDRAVDNNPCPASLGASASYPHFLPDAGATTVLRSSIELFEDGVGDEDGFCEANEACLYTPNNGMYQGRGPLISAPTCLGGVSGFPGVSSLRHQFSGE
ncbi:MAG: hypothetical protein JNK82_11960, partial [Myxococcaceae bacterium]|nr:hypothetical protein [Myxococcaceae bacterium]